MKTLYLMLLSGFITLSAMAQTVTLTFNGANKNRNYQVLIDGTSYYSNNSSATSNNSVKKLVVNTLQPGSHTINIYKQRNNNINGNSNPAGQPVYTNNFTIRSGYDMDIRINGNGQVSFSEKQIRNRGRYGNRGTGNQTTVVPMADASYNQILQSVRSKWLQPQKLSLIQQTFSNTSNYFSTQQVRQLIQLITSENNRLAMAKLVYGRVTDPANFTGIYDLFTSASSRDEMNVYISNNPNYNNSNYNNNNNGNNNNGYRSPMSDYQFTQLVQNVSGQYNTAARYNLIRDAFSNYSNYFNTTQIRQLLLLMNAEPDRLSLAKLSFARASDPANFSMLYDVFSTQAARNDLNYFVIQNGGTGSKTQYNSRVAVTDAVFAPILQKATNHFLPWDKVRDVREALSNTQNYYTTEQIRQLISLAGSESDRLELAKVGWSRVSDPNYFTQLMDLLPSQSSKDELNAYIAAHPF